MRNLTITGQLGVRCGNDFSKTKNASLKRRQRTWPAQPSPVSLTASSKRACKGWLWSLSFTSRENESEQRVFSWKHCASDSLKRNEFIFCFWERKEIKNGRNMTLKSRKIPSAILQNEHVSSKSPKTKWVDFGIFLENLRVPRMWEALWSSCCLTICFFSSDLQTQTKYPCLAERCCYGKNTKYTWFENFYLEFLSNGQEPWNQGLSLCKPERCYSIWE